jgi:Wiskott-Aldrich syndrome protein
VLPCSPTPQRFLRAADGLAATAVARALHTCSFPLNPARSRPDLPAPPASPRQRRPPRSRPPPNVPPSHPAPGTSPHRCLRAPSPRHNPRYSAHQTLGPLDRSAPPRTRLSLLHADRPALSPGPPGRRPLYTALPAARSSGPPPLIHHLPTLTSFPPHTPPHSPLALPCKAPSSLCAGATTPRFTPRTAAPPPLPLLTSQSLFRTLPTSGPVPPTKSPILPTHRIAPSPPPLVSPTPRAHAPPLGSPRARPPDIARARHPLLAPHSAIPPPPSHPTPRFSMEDRLSAPLTPPPIPPPMPVPPNCSHARKEFPPPGAADSPNRPDPLGVSEVASLA